MDNKLKLQDIVDLINDAEGTTISGVECLIEDNIRTREEITELKEYIKKEFEKDQRFAVLDLLIDIAVVFIGTILALLACGIIYY